MSSTPLLCSVVSSLMAGVCHRPTSFSQQISPPFEVHELRIVRLFFVSYLLLYELYSTESSQFFLFAWCQSARHWERSLSCRPFLKLSVRFLALLSTCAAPVKVWCFCFHLSSCFLLMHCSMLSCLVDSLICVMNLLSFMAGRCSTSVGHVDQPKGTA